MKAPILLVLDNANEANEIKKFNEDFGKLGLHVLVTSRCKNVMVNPVEEMPINHLSSSLARTLFIEYYKEDNEEFNSLLDQFLEAISYHTLLIEVFAKNLQEATSFGASGLSMKSFLQKLESSGLFLKEKSFGMYTDYTGYVKKDAVTTDDILDILFDFSKLEEQERVLLVNFSLLPIASYDIPSLVRLMEPEDHYQYGNTLKKLFRMGWIGGGDRSFRISPVIQKLVIEKNRETLWEDGVDLVNEINSNMELMSEEDAIVEKIQWIPYAENFYKIYGGNLNYQEYIELLRNYSVILSHGKNKNNFLRAIDLLQQILNFDLKYYNENSSVIINNKIRLSAILSETGEKENLILAKDILSQVLSSTLANNPRNKILIATLHSNLALILKDIGGIDNIKKAINIVKICFNYINETNTHYINLTLRHTLSLLLYELNDRNSLLEAMFNLECNLNSFSSSSETHDIEYAMTYSLLGQVLLALGGKENVTKAQFLIEESIKLFKTILGDDNLLIAHNYSNLSLILNDIDRVKNTEISIKLSLKALEIIEKNGSKGTLDHFILNNNLALALQSSGKLSNLIEAKAILKESLNFIRTSIYCGHYIEGQCLSNLAMILYDIGEEDNLKTAIPLLIKALEIQEMNFKKDSSQFGLVENNLARILADLGGKTNLIEARRLSQDALRIEIINHGLESIQSLTCLCTLFSVLKELGDEDALMSYLGSLKEGFKYLLNHYGEEYELTMIVKNLLKYC